MRVVFLQCMLNEGVFIMDENKIILFPDYEELKKEVQKLQTEISILLLERDELRFVICRNIETAYMLAVGSLEYKAYELHCKVLRIKRKIELIQAKKNRQEKVELSDIEEQLDEEFEEYQNQLDEKISKMNTALDYSKGTPLTQEENKEIKKLYRNIVKALHPDLHPDVTDAQLQLFQNAVLAYESGDLSSMRIIFEMVAEPDISEICDNSMVLISKEKDRLLKSLETIQQQISQIKNDYPYTMKDFINNPEKIEKKKAEFKALIDELNDVYNLYKSRLKDLLR